MATVTPAAQTTSSSRVVAFFKDYAAYHRTPGNQLCHMIGIPLIVMTLMGLLSHFVLGQMGSPFLRVDGGTILWLLAMCWYFVIDWKLAVPFSLVTLGLYFIGRTLPVPALWTLFIAGWVFQFIGHYVFEKKSPAFYKNGEHLLVGPLWVFAKITGARRS